MQKLYTIGTRTLDVLVSRTSMLAIRYPWLANTAKVFNALNPVMTAGYLAMTLSYPSASVGDMLMSTYYMLGCAFVAALAFTEWSNPFIGKVFSVTGALNAIKSLAHGYFILGSTDASVMAHWATYANMGLVIALHLRLAWKLRCDWQERNYQWQSLVPAAMESVVELTKSNLVAAKWGVNIFIGSNPLIGAYWLWMAYCLNTSDLMNVGTSLVGVLIYITVVSQSAQDKKVFTVFLSALIVSLATLYTHATKVVWFWREDFGNALCAGFVLCAVCWLMMHIIQQMKTAPSN